MQRFYIHPDNPQPRALQQAVAVLKKSGVIIYPTDTAYALACQFNDKAALNRLYQIRKLDEKHQFTLLCNSLSDVGTYGELDNRNFALVKKMVPGAYTFILKASREVPKRLLHVKLKTIGFRISAHPVPRELLTLMEEPLITTSLIPPGNTDPLRTPEEILDRYENQVDLMLDVGELGDFATSIVDLSQSPPLIIRTGKGDTTLFGHA